MAHKNRAMRTTNLRTPEAQSSLARAIGLTPRQSPKEGEQPAPVYPIDFFVVGKKSRSEPHICNFKLVTSVVLMTLKQPPPLSLRLSPELETALRNEAASLGLGLSEVLRRRIVSGSTGEPEHREVAVEGIAAR